MQKTINISELGGQNNESYRCPQANLHEDRCLASRPDRAQSASAAHTGGDITPPTAEAQRRSCPQSSCSNQSATPASDRSCRSLYSKSGCMPQSAHSQSTCPPFPS